MHTKISVESWDCKELQKNSRVGTHAKMCGKMPFNMSLNIQHPCSLLLGIRP